MWLALPLSTVLVVAAGEAGTEEANASLRVVPVDGWAEVLVDGIVVGLGPVEVRLRSGLHVVELEETEYHRASRLEVWVEPGGSVEVTVQRTFKPSWVVPRGFPEGTWLRLDGGPGPQVTDETKLVIDDGRRHRLEFRLGETTLEELVLRRCVETGCLLPGTTRVVRWSGGKSSEDGPAP